MFWLAKDDVVCLDTPSREYFEAPLRKADEERVMQFDSRNLSLSFRAGSRSGSPRN